MSSSVVSTGWCPSQPPRTTRARRVDGLSGEVMVPFRGGIDSVAASGRAVDAGAVGGPIAEAIRVPCPGQLGRRRRGHAVKSAPTAMLALARGSAMTAPFPADRTVLVTGA